MYVIEGHCNLYDFLSTIASNKELLNKYEHLIENKSYFFSKVELPFIKELLTTPIIIYLKKDSIRNNSFESNLKDYVTKISYLDNPELVAFLDKVDKSIRKEINVKWIALELDNEVNFNITKLCKEFVYLDYNLDKKSTNGRIDINEYENRAKKYFDQIEKKYFKQFRGFFMKNLFKIQLSCEKRTYFKKELKQIDNFENELENHVDKYFSLKCLLCKQTSIVSTNQEESNVLKPKDIFKFNKDTNKITFKCNHKNVNKQLKDIMPYSCNNFFSFKPCFEIDQNNFDDIYYSYALLQYFYTFDISKKDMEMKYLDTDNQIKNTQIEKYLMEHTYDKK